MEQKPCVRCERLVDPFARICPFCNWDQELPPPKENPLASSIALEEEQAQLAGQRRQHRKRILLTAGIAALLLLTFAIGSFVSRLGRKPRTPEEVRPVAVSQHPAQSPTQLTDLRLVPVDLTSTVGGSITSVPQQSGGPAGAAAGDRSDATALPSQQYAELVRRSSQQPVAQAGGADTLDPRTIIAKPIPQIRRPAPAPPSPRPPPPLPLPTGSRPANRTVKTTGSSPSAPAPNQSRSRFPI